MQRSKQQLMNILIGLLAFIGVAASIGFYFREPANSGLSRFPIITALHIILGAIYLTLAPFQFIGKIRVRWLGFHTWVGRVLVSIGIVVGITALFMTLIIPFSGWSERLIVSPFAVLFSLALIQGYRFARTKQIMLHKFWMMRAFAIGLAIATTRLIFIPSLIVLIKLGNPVTENIALLSTISFTLAFLIHIVVVESWIFRDKQINSLTVRS